MKVKRVLLSLYIMNKNAKFFDMFILLHNWWWEWYYVPIVWDTISFVLQEQSGRGERGTYDIWIRRLAKSVLFLMVGESKYEQTVIVLLNFF